MRAEGGGNEVEVVQPRVSVHSRSFRRVCLSWWLILCLTTLFVSLATLRFGDSVSLNVTRQPFSLSNLTITHRSHWLAQSGPVYSGQLTDSPRIPRILEIFSKLNLP